MKVTVTVTDCPAQDARTVLEVLAKGFPSSDRGPGDMPQDTPGAGPTVWTSVFDVPDDAHTDGAAGPSSLSGPVTVTLQGTPEGVELVRDALNAGFSLVDEGEASGDQEREVRLRLAGRDG
ncbi:hypothetical protein ACQPZG_16830 [Streptomyces sp. CA-294286]|uniref:hypothetical protein n=1 Tax=Streptomyces sp. CA-294286 TaxID=3240070 RepID=UPI003D925311